MENSTSVENPVGKKQSFLGNNWGKILIAAIIALWAIPVNNTIIEKDQTVKKAVSNLSSQYKRRADLVPQLTAIVGGYAKHENSTLTGVIQARSTATSIQLTPEVLKDPEAMKRFQESQNILTGALSKLMMLQEQYPNLKADKGFQDMQSQIEGTENRINVARERSIEAITDFNNFILKLPNSIIAYIRGDKEKPNYLDENDKANQKSPEIKFGQ